MILLMTRLVAKEAIERVVAVITDAVVDITMVMVVQDSRGCQRRHHSQHLLVDCHPVLSKETLFIYSKN